MSDLSDKARKLLVGFYKTVDVMKSAYSKNDKMMSVWADDLYAVEAVMSFLETIRDAPAQGECRCRENALEEAARIAANGCLVAPDGGSPTEAERQMCEDIASRIRSRKQDPGEWGMGCPVHSGQMNVADIDDVDMRELLSAKDVGKGRSILKRILSSVSSPGASEMVAVPRAALDWLFGERPAPDGMWFGEDEDVAAIGKRRARYWWRSKFRSMIPSFSSTDSTGGAA